MGIVTTNQAEYKENTINNNNKTNHKKGQKKYLISHFFERKNKNQAAIETSTHMKSINEVSATTSFNIDTDELSQSTTLTIEENDRIELNNINTNTNHDEGVGKGNIISNNTS
jgi:hypothetical protein